MRSKYNVVRRYYDEIWGDILLRCKTVKFLKRLFRLRKRKYLSRWKRFLNFNITYQLRLKFPRTAYGKLMIHKQKVRKFYTYLTEHQLREIFTRSDKHAKYWISYFYYQLERRVETLLYRANFVSSIRESKQLVIHGYAQLNGCKISRSSITIDIGDFLQFTPVFVYQLKLFQKLKNFRVFMFYPSYLEVDYRTFTILLYEKPLGGQVFYPFHFNHSQLANFYRSI